MNLNTATAEGATQAIAEILISALLKDVRGGGVSLIDDKEPAQRLLALADTHRSKFVVHGQQGSGGLGEFLYGSVITAVAPAARCDGLMVPRDKY